MIFPLPQSHDPANVCCLDFFGLCSNLLIQIYKHMHIMYSHSRPRIDVLYGVYRGLFAPSLLRYEILCNMFCPDLHDFL